MGNKEKIKQAIKKHFKTQRNLCNLLQLQEKEFPRKISSRVSAIEKQNEFFAPIGLRWELTEVEPKKIQ